VIAVMTGAPIPAGADGVVPVEEVEQLETSIRISRPVAADRFIARRGSDIRAQQLVLSRGSRLGPAQLAVAASVGAANIRVFAKPQAAVLATGNELVAVDHEPGPAHIRNSNSIMLISLLRKLGCDVTDLGVAPDQPDAVRDALKRGMQHELLFVTGGMSMGTYDYVPRMVRELGADLKITKLRIKPGKPFVYAQTPTGHVFGLPGNPVSAFVCAVRLASRLIARLCGQIELERWLSGPLEKALGPNCPREFYHPAIIKQNGHIEPLTWKGSADVFTLAKANALLRRAENEPPVAVGAIVRVLEI
jgi:molybdopterin molybdotransferase